MFLLTSLEVLINCNNLDLGFEPRATRRGCVSLMVEMLVG
jgi:hypothetical protein